MLKSEQLDRLMGQAKVNNSQKVESKKLEAKILEQSGVDDNSNDSLSINKNEILQADMQIEQ